jgi:hypothetical protein
MPRHYAKKVNKFVTLAVSVLVALNGGVSYAYGLWAPLLKRHGLDQRDVAILGGSFNVRYYETNPVRTDAAHTRSHPCLARAL